MATYTYRLNMAGCEETVIEGVTFKKATNINYSSDQLALNKWVPAKLDKWVDGILHNSENEAPHIEDYQEKANIRDAIYSYDSNGNVVGVALPGNTGILSTLSRFTLPANQCIFRGFARVGLASGQTDQTLRISSLNKVDTRENITRIFITCLAADVNSAFIIPASEITAALADSDLYASYGLKTVLVIQPAITGVSNAQASTEFWSSETAKNNYISSVISFARNFINNNNIFIELINEPFVVTAADADSEWTQLTTFYNAIINGIRAFDKGMYLIVSSGGGAITNRFKNMTPLSDQRIIYNAHFYLPFAVTHQASGAGIAYPSATNYGGIGSPYTSEATVLNDLEGLKLFLKPMKEFGIKYGVPLICTEFGVNRKTPSTTSVKWTKDAIEALEDAKVNWINWGDFGIYDADWGSFYMSDNAYVKADYPWSSGAIDSYNPACVVIGNCKNNIKINGGRAKQPSVYRFSSNFDDGFVNMNATVVAGTGTVATNATQNPKNGTLHGRFTSSANANTVANEIRMGENGSFFNNTPANNIAEVNFDFVMSALPATGTTLNLARVWDNGGALAVNSRVYVKATPLGKLQIETQGKVYVPEMPKLLGVKYSGNSSLKIFNYPYVLSNFDNIRVWVNGALMTYGVDYSFIKKADNTIDVLFVTAPSTATDNIFLTEYRNLSVRVYSHATKGSIIVLLDNEPVFIMIPDTDSAQPNVVTLTSATNCWRPGIYFMSSTPNLILDVDNLITIQEKT